MTVETVLFDLDGTLLDRRATFRRHLELQIGRHADLFDGAEPGRYMDELLALDENGTLDRADFFHQAERRFSLPPGASSELLADFEEHFPESCVPSPGMRETLEALSVAGIRLGLVTNGRVLIQSRKIERLGIRPLLGCTVISEAVGFRKPDPRIFHAALEELGASPSASAYVGDNPEADVAGARASGLVAVWKRDDFWPEPAEADLVIDELAELPRRLAELE